ncbi:MAG: hypothetical protein L0Z49_10215 [Actinobacteria bacterium]|nr:hypothetical protein [Actinomycetota bacterium]MCI0677957.1 hypothetical protein [Actinomycetota bacterium]
MSSYQGVLRIEGADEAPVRVLIDLTDDRLRMTAGDVELADWPRDEIRVSALMDGFHIRAEGEEVVLDVNEDARFALDLGLRNAHPVLRRRMSALLREMGAVEDLG